jgi:methyl-accepting chemotaxis protein
MAQVTAKMAEGDLTERATVSSKDEVGKLAASFNLMADNLANGVRGLQQTSASLNEVASTVTDSAKQVGQGAEQVAAAVGNIAQGASANAEETQVGAEAVQAMREAMEKVVAAADQAAASVDTLRQATQASRSAVEDLNDRTRESLSVMGELQSAANGITKNSREIGSIVQAIESISFQTNLLALNAAIEAARAGEAGRGFAVVADEVRKLAEQSSLETKKVTDIIAKMEGAIGQVMAQVSNAEKIVRLQEEAVKQNDGAVNAAAAALEGIVGDVNEASRLASGMQEFASQVTRAIESISAGSEQTAASAEEVAAATEEQTAMVEQLQTMAETLNTNAAALNQMVKRYRL